MDNNGVHAHSCSATPQHMQYRATICHKHMTSCSACIWRSQYAIKVRKLNGNVRLLSQSQRLKLIEWEVAFSTGKLTKLQNSYIGCSVVLLFKAVFWTAAVSGWISRRQHRNKCYLSVRRRFEDELFGSLWGESSSSWNGDSALSRALRRRPLLTAGVTIDWSKDCRETDEATPGSLLCPFLE